MSVGTRIASDRPPVGFADTVRYIAVAGVAGVVTGLLVGGLGSRLFMRIAGAAGRDLAQGLPTEAGFTVGEVTLGGTLALVVFVGVFSGIVGAVFYLVLRPWLAWAGPWRGVVFGVVLFAVGSASSDVMNPDNRDFFLLDRDVLNVSLIVALFLGFGVVLEAIHRRLDARMPEGEQSTVIYTVICAFGAVLGIPLIIGTMFAESGCDCEKSPWIAWSLVVTAVGAVAWWLGGRDERWSPFGRVLGYGGLVGATGFGLLQAIGDAIEILG